MSGYLILTSINLYDYISPFSSYSFDCDEISNRLESVPPPFQTPRRFLGVWISRWYCSTHLNARVKLSDSGCSAKESICCWFHLEDSKRKQEQYIMRNSLVALNWAFVITIDCFVFRDKWYSKAEVTQKERWAVDQFRKTSFQPQPNLSHLTNHKTHE